MRQLEQRFFFEDIVQDTNILQCSSTMNVTITECKIVVSRCVSGGDTEALFMDKGYIPDESHDYDEFFICVTEKATDEVTEIIEKVKKEQEARLNNTVNKAIKEWASQGCEEEVTENIMRNNRPLIEVEVETRYPIFPGKTQFRMVRVNQTRDGYMELRSTEETFSNVFRKRIDAAVQVAPSCISAEAQTNCAYPVNATTQYLYETVEDKRLLDACKPSIVAYADKNMENISDILTVNGVFNLYSDDFSPLAVNPDGVWAHTVVVDTIKEYMSFMDVGLCKGKRISDAVWHPMWTGTVAISYADIAINDYLSGQPTDDQVLKAVHGLNPVLLWSTSDALKPKLILESPREVHKLSFCPFDENILIGGCKDGQIIIWDIRNKLTKVEELEVLTTAQQKYRTYMNSLMGWMKNVHDLSLVRPTAVSDPRYTHKGPVTSFAWVSPFTEFSKMGSLDLLPEGQTSMQLMSASEDGTVLIWDLLKRPKVEAGGYKVKKLKRLKKKPSALMMDASPLHVLHLTLKPTYKVFLRRPGEKVKNLAIVSLFSLHCKMNYRERNPGVKKTSMNERIYYDPVMTRGPMEEAEQLPIHLGSMEGDYATIKWEGQDFDSGEAMNSEVGQSLCHGKYHDGPVAAVQTHKDLNMYLTAGGRVFAIWREDFKDRPVLWRKCKYKLTSAKFNVYQPYMFTTLLMSGHVENWVLTMSSKHPVRSYMYSSQYITVSTVHPTKMKKNIYGAGDKQGAFRLFFLTSETKETVDAKNAAFMEFMDREVERKKAFAAWQDEWNGRHVGCLQRKEEDLRERKAREEAERQRRAAEIFQKKEPEKPPPKGPQPGKFIEWMIEQRELERDARIKSMIIRKKQLDTKELEKRRKPLQKLEEENEMKRRKQRQRLREGESIFQTTVATLFPEMVKQKPVPPPDPYAGGDPKDTLESCYKKYEQLARAAEDFVHDNPYNYEFDWRHVLDNGKVRRRQLDQNELPQVKSLHNLRKTRMSDEAKAEAAEVRDVKVQFQEKDEEVEEATVELENAEEIPDDE